MDWSDYEVDGQLSIFDLIETENEPFNPLEALALRGTGFRDGMKRVKAYFNENHTISEKAKFSKKGIRTRWFWKSNKETLLYTFNGHF